MSTLFAAGTDVSRVPHPAPAPITRAMHVLNLLALLAVAGAFVLLFVFSERTHDLFSWTIDPPAAAALLGAGYGSIVVSSLWTTYRPVLDAAHALRAAGGQLRLRISSHR